MAEQTPVFLGLIRPPKLLGLPVMYGVFWLFGAAILFVILQHWIVPVVAALAYPAIWLAADWDPHFLDVTRTVMRHTPRRPVRSDDGLTHYAP